MKKNNGNISWKLIVLILVSAAFILARFSLTRADEISSQPDTTATVQITGAQNHESTSSYFEERANSNSMTGPLIKLLVALVVVVAGIYGFLIVLRRMMGSKFSGNRTDGLIEILETTYIAQKKSVSLIRFGEKAVLVGVTDGAISVLAELNADETDKVVTAVKTGKKDTGFKSVFSGARDKLKSFDIKRLSASWTPKEADSPQTV